MDDPNGATTKRITLTVSLDPLVVHMLRQAIDQEEQFGSYLEHLVLQRSRLWRGSLHMLEDIRCTRDDIEACHAALRNELFLEAFKPKELAATLRQAGLRSVSRRVCRREATVYALLCVLVELRAGNAACARAVRLMRPVARWWRRAR